MRNLLSVRFNTFRGMVSMSYDDGTIDIYRYSRAMLELFQASDLFRIETNNNVLIFLVVERAK